MSLAYTIAILKNEKINWQKIHKTINEKHLKLLMFKNYSMVVILSPSFTQPRRILEKNFWQIQIANCWATIEKKKNEKLKQEKYFYKLGPEKCENFQFITFSSSRHLSPSYLDMQKKFPRKFHWLTLCSIVMNLWHMLAACCNVDWIKENCTDTY